MRLLPRNFFRSYCRKFNVKKHTLQVFREKTSGTELIHRESKQKTVIPICYLYRQDSKRRRRNAIMHIVVL